MEIKRIKIGVCFAVMVAGLIGESMAQPRDPCISATTTLLPCLPFVTGDQVTPTAGCCAAFSGVLQAQPNCLCVILKGGSPLPLNQTLALQLPEECRVKTPPATQCDKASRNESAMSPSPSNTPSNTLTVPAPAPPSGGTNSLRGMPYIHLVASFLVAISLGI